MGGNQDDLHALHVLDRLIEVELEVELEVNTRVPHLEST